MIKETMEFLSQYDPEVGATIEKEYHREQRNIELIASENIVSPDQQVRRRLSRQALLRRLLLRRRDRRDRPSARLQAVRR